MRLATAEWNQVGQALGARVWRISTVCWTTPVAKYLCPSWLTKLTPPPPSCLVSASQGGRTRQALCWQPQLQDRLRRPAGVRAPMLVAHAVIAFTSLPILSARHPDMHLVLPRAAKLRPTSDPPHSISNPGAASMRSTARRV